MGWKCVECDLAAEKWGLCEKHWAFYMHPSRQGGNDESTPVVDKPKP